jgi:DNA-binding FadR family transcriptional regulator
MLVTTNPQQTLWETILPPGYQDLPKELALVDALLVSRTINSFH